jgi:Putative zinc-finger
MNHAEVRSRLIDYMEGDLVLSKRALVDAHLDQCDECSGELAQLKRMVSLLRELPDPEPPAGLAARVMARIQAGEGRPGLLGRLRLAPLPGSSGWARLAAPLAVAVAAAAAAIFVAGPPPGHWIPAPATPVREPSPSVAQRLPAPRTDLRERVEEVAQPLAGPQAPSAFAPDVASVTQPGALPALPVDPTQPVSESAQKVSISTTTAVAPAPEASGTPAPLSGPMLSPTLDERIVRPTAGRVAASPEVSESRQERIDRTRDGWLDWIKANPRAYVQEYQGYSAGERPNWVRSLAQRAQERGDLGDVLAALRGTDASQAEEIARAFEAAVSERPEGSAER